METVMCLLHRVHPWMTFLDTALLQISCKVLRWLVLSLGLHGKFFFLVGDQLFHQIRLQLRPLPRLLLVDVFRSKYLPLQRDRLLSAFDASYILLFCPVCCRGGTLFHRSRGAPCRYAFSNNLMPSCFVTFSTPCRKRSESKGRSVRP